MLVCIRAKQLIHSGAYPGILCIKQLEALLLPPGWNIYRKVTRSPGISYDFPDSSSVPIYTPERKETMREYSKLICPKTQLELCFRASPDFLARRPAH